MLLALGLISIVIAEPAIRTPVGLHTSLGHHLWYWRVFPTAAQEVGLVFIAAAIALGYGRPPRT